MPDHNKGTGAIVGGLLGGQFQLITDYSPLQWMAQNEENNAMVTLQDFEIHVDIRHLPNKEDLMDYHVSMCILARCVPSHRSDQRVGVCGALIDSIVDYVYVLPRLLTPIHGKRAPGTNMKKTNSVLFWLLESGDFEELCAGSSLHF